MNNKFGARTAGCELFAALMKGDATHAALLQTTGIATNAIYDWLNEMHRSGIVYRRRAQRVPGRRGIPAVIWCLQPKPFEREDWS